MTKKGLFVTLVLDCCFSGSTLRLGYSINSTIRMTSYDPVIDAAYPSEEANLNSAQEPYPLRDAIALPRWLISPNYTMLTACAPHEIAEEFETETKDTQIKERRGALSYFLLEALISLRRSGVEVTHSSLHQDLLMKFYTYWPRETPMRRGNKDLSFFGWLRFESDLTFIPIFKADDGRISLNAGHIYDVHEGDEYAFSPFHTSESTLHQVKTPSLRFRVNTVGCLTSDLVAIGSSSTAHREVETGWKARLLTQFPAWNIPVRIMTNLSNKAQWTAFGRQHSILRLHIADEEQENCLFNVFCNVNGEYEILDASHKKTVYAPTISAKQEDAMGDVMSVLQHLAKFKRFEGIENRVPDVPFKQSFRISSTCAYEATGSYDISHGDGWKFAVENLSDRLLFLAIVNLRPSGQITNLVSDFDGGFKAIGPKSKFEDSMTMEIPESLQQRGQQECTDIMKFFITSKPICLPPEIVPDVPFAKESRKNLRGSNDQLLKCLSILETHFRDAQDDPWNRDWASRNFLYPHYHNVTMFIKPIVTVTKCSKA